MGRHCPCRGRGQRRRGVGLLRRRRAYPSRSAARGLRTSSLSTHPTRGGTSASVGARPPRVGQRMTTEHPTGQMATHNVAAGAAPTHKVVAGAAPTDKVVTYYSNGNEVQLFEQAFYRNLPVMLTGPTGCGKTRFVEHMGSLLGRPVVTISCHDDLTSSDLVGRFMVTGGDVVWTDGPLTRAVKTGAICYLDEVVEARHDSLAILHSLTDHRRALYLDRAGEVVHAPTEFMLVCSYNPAYRSSLKELKPSFRQRFVTLPMNYLPPDREAEVVVAEAGVDLPTARRLVGCATAIRTADEALHFEPPSTRGIVPAEKLIT